MLEHGRDTYGEIHTGLFMAQIDADQRTHLPFDEKPLRNGRLAKHDSGAAKRPTNAVNVVYDHGLLRLLYMLTEHGHGEKYGEAADQSIHDFFKYSHNLNSVPKSEWSKHTNLDVDGGNEPVSWRDAEWAPAWGDHSWYNAVTDKAKFGVHEFKWTHGLWSEMARVNSNRTRDVARTFRRHITQFTDPVEPRWKNIYETVPHVEPGVSIRHWPQPKVFAMPSSIAYWISGWAEMYRMTDDRKYLDWIREQLKYIRKYHGDAGFFGTPLHAPRGNATLYTTPWGTCSIGLLKASEILSDHPVGQACKKQAAHYLSTFIKHADLKKDGSHYTRFDIDSGEGTKRRKGWQEYSVRTLAGLAYGYRMLGDRAIKEFVDVKLDAFGLDRFETNNNSLLNDAIPDKAWIGKLTHVMNALLNMYIGSGESEYLTDARRLADYVIDNYFVNGLFITHHQKQNVNIYYNRLGGDDMAYGLFLLHLALDGESIDQYYFDPLVAY